MAKRFTDTSKWQEDWFLSLPNDYRIIWQYLQDHCSVAGIWKKTMRHLNLFCNTNITSEELLEIFGDRIIEICGGEKYLIITFLEEQYSTGLQSNKPLIVSVRKEIERNNCSVIIKERLGNDYAIIKERVREREKGKGEDKREKGGMGEKEREEGDGNLSQQMRQMFLNLPDNNHYVWSEDDGYPLHAIRSKITKLIQNGKKEADGIIGYSPPDDEVLEFWRVFLDKMPEWWKNNGLDLSTLNKNFNKIITAIKSNSNEKRQSVPSEEEIDAIIDSGQF